MLHGLGQHKMSMGADDSPLGKVSRRFEDSLTLALVSRYQQNCDELMDLLERPDLPTRRLIRRTAPGRPLISFPDLKAETESRTPRPAQRCVPPLS